MDLTTTPPRRRDVPAGALRALGRDRRRVAARRGRLGRRSSPRSSGSSAPTRSAGDRDADVAPGGRLALVPRGQRRRAVADWVRRGTLRPRAGASAAPLDVRADPRRASARARRSRCTRRRSRSSSPSLSWLAPDARSRRRSRCGPSTATRRRSSPAARSSRILLNQRLIAPAALLSLRRRRRARRDPGRRRAAPRRAWSRHRAVERSPRSSRGLAGAGARVRARREPARAQPGDRRRRARRRRLRLRPAGDARARSGARVVVRSVRG